ncbi:hypothetical protein MLD38_031937 [Melastoma candidum]|uniref:Uncharacterized protein n=1 Tax=Melastoma candidum TaxID=119954 RepID=A0ACB9MR47_9MYRT|nr:hypothetical protein MLD38_031937 [Melastoma candidum]
MAGGSGFSPLVQSQNLPSGPNPFFLPGSDAFPGEHVMLSFEDARGGDVKSGQSFVRSFETTEDDLGNYYLQQPNKKRRLTADQVQFLEESFGNENKLEPERKVQLAKELGLQPRQIAIWFQNRRARWKTKQLEKEYDTLQASYNSLKTDFEELVKERDQLKDQVHDLTDKLQLKGKQVENSDISRKASEGLVQIPITESVSKEQVSRFPNILQTKHEEICSTKSDVLDSDSPRHTNCDHSSLLEPGDASYAFEPDRSDISQDEEDNLMLGSNHFADSPVGNACAFGFWAAADEPAFWSWSY